MTTDEYLEFAGVSLHQQGWSVTSIGTRFTVPPLRGDNARAANTVGELWLPKIPDARTITLSMWVRGRDPVTGDAVDDPRLRFNDNWAYLRQVFWNPDAESPLVRRWARTDPTTGVAGIAWAEAYAQLAPGADLPLKMTSRLFAEFEVPLRLAHPFFYGPTVQVTLPVGQPVSVVNPGDWAAWSKYVYVDLVGPLTGARVTNVTGAGSVYCGLVGAVAAGETLTLDVRNFVAVSQRAGSNVQTQRTGEIYNSGALPWLALVRGTNQLTLTGTGTGHAVLRYRPPYL
jgi:hypothetical protein